MADAEREKIVLKALGLLLLVGYLALIWWLERRRQVNSPWHTTPTERRIRLVPRLRDKRKSKSCEPPP